MLRTAGVMAGVLLLMGNALAAPGAQPPLNVTGTVAVTNPPGAVGAAPMPLLVTGTMTGAVTVEDDVYVRSATDQTGMTTHTKSDGAENTTDATFDSGFYFIPTGKRLVVEHVSVLVKASNGSGTMFSTALFGQMPHPSPGVEVPQLFIGTATDAVKCDRDAAGKDLWCLGTTVPLRLLVDGGSSSLFTIRTRVQFYTAADVLFHWTWTGYLVDAE